MVAAQLAQVNGHGKAFRHGGEEFTILFPGEDAHAALLHVDALRQRIAKTPFLLRKRSRRKPHQPVHRERIEKITVTVNAGVAQRQDQCQGPY